MSYDNKGMSLFSEIFPLTLFNLSPFFNSCSGNQKLIFIPALNVNLKKSIRSSSEPCFEIHIDIVQVINSSELIIFLSKIIFGQNFIS